jgi:two-component system, LytTR family, response regulator LytT
MRVVIAEDDERFADLLSRLLALTGSVEVVGSARTGEECIRLVGDQRPDLLLLDIEMPQLSGIEVAEITLASEDPPFIVFITGHDEYAVKAFGLRAMDYIVKPVDPGELAGRLADMLTRVEEELQHRELALEQLRGRINAAAEQLDDSAGSPAAQPIRGRLPVKDYAQGTLRILATTAISHITRERRHVVVHTENEALPTTYTVERLARRLSADGFVQISSGALANLSYVRHMIPNGDGSYDVFLSDPGETVLLSPRARAQELLRRLSG